jgi:hypothetical protein
MGASGNARGGADTRTDFRTGFDYRWQRYPGGRRVHPNDGSVAVFKVTATQKRQTVQKKQKQTGT